MKLSQYAKQQGISYRTALRWFQAGTIKGYQAPTGTIIVTEGETPTPHYEKVAIYARVSSTEHRENLERQAERLSQYCEARGYQVSQVVKEIASGVNDSRPKLLSLLKDTSITCIVVEHKDRLTRFGFHYLETLLRQSFIHTGKYLGYAEVYHLVKQTDAYKSLPRKVSNDVLRLLDKNWKAFRKALAAWYEDPSQFLGRPCLPKYKDKQKGRNILVYDIQALSRTARKYGVIAPSQLGITVPTKHKDVKQVRIVPRKGYYVVEVVYERKEIQTSVNPALMASIDIGVNNLVALTSKLVGIQVVLQEESYTSKVSFLDSDSIPTYGKCEEEPHLSGRRVKRGLYKISNGRKINADVNGSLNILRKASPNAFGNGVEAVAVQPVRLAV
jgi:predicted site-specific integrase-resolvase